ncbi:MAG: sodium:solute symporter family protein [Phycisphaerae bacterium]|nr:sodium:solute symporter family protein [Phycisphaerae bacterium]
MYPVAGLLAIALFYALVFLVGLYAGRRSRGDEGSSGLLVAGRRMPILLGVVTMTATWVGGGYINGTAEAVYDSARGLVWAQAPWGYALSLVLGGLVFARKMRRLGFTTLLDPFERRYGKQIPAVLFLAALVGEVFWSAAILAALGTTFGTILGFDFTTSILISAAIAIAYTVVGGLWSVAYTDVLQLACILLGLGIAIPFALQHAGGLSNVVATYGAKFGPAASLLPPIGQWGNKTWYWLDLALLLILGGIPWQVYFQRVLACRSPRSAVYLSVFAGVGCIILAIPAGLIGAIGAAVDWHANGLQPPPTPALVLPYVLQYLTNPVIAVVGLGAVAAAVMSSVDSSILSASSMFAWNVYRPLIHPAASDREIRLAMRVAVLFVGAAATALALITESVYVLWYLCADLVYVILFPQLVMALFCKGANRIGSLAGAIVGLVLRLGGGEPALGIPALIPYPMQDPDLGSVFPFRTTAMLAGLLTIWIVSRLTAGLSPPQPLPVADERGANA